MKYPETFWCIGCESDHPFEHMTSGLCPECAKLANQQAISLKDLWTIRLCLFGLVLIAIAVIVNPPF